MAKLVGQIIDKKKVIVGIILIAIGTLFLPLSNSQANPIGVINSNFRGIYPLNDTSIEINRFDVCFEILVQDYTIKKTGSFNIKMSANYSFFNPNETTTFTIGAPFGFGASSEEALKNASVKVNDEIQSFEVITFDNEAFGDLNDFSDYGIDLFDIFLIFNATFIKEEFANISIAYERMFTKPSNGQLIVSYTIGTANAWSGNLTEEIIYDIQGKQPDSFFPESHLTISEISDNQKKYIWEWDNEIIEHTDVGVRYNHFQRPQFTTFFGFEGVYIGLVIVLLPLTYIYKRKKIA